MTLLTRREGDADGVGDESRGGWRACRDVGDGRGLWRRMMTPNST